MKRHLSTATSTLSGMRVRPTLAGLLLALGLITVAQPQLLQPVPVSAASSHLHLSHTAVSFGMVTMGTTSRQKFSVTLLPGAGVIESVRLTRTHEFQATYKCGQRADGDGRCTIALTFRPSSIDTFKTSVVVTTTMGDKIVVPVSAMGVPHTGGYGS